MVVKKNFVHAYIFIWDFLVVSLFEFNDAGNGVETSYIPPEPSHMWIPNVSNMQGMNFNLPNNYIGPININDISTTFPNGLN